MVERRPCADVWFAGRPFRNGLAIGYLIGQWVCELASGTLKSNSPQKFTQSQRDAGTAIHGIKPADDDHHSYH
jgi:hypothetical protein